MAAGSSGGDRRGRRPAAAQEPPLEHGLPRGHALAWLLVALSGTLTALFFPRAFHPGRFFLTLVSRSFRAQALAPRDPEFGQKEFIGCFESAVEAAVAYALHVRRLRQLEHPEHTGSVFDEVCTHAEGVALHLSERSSTGYEGVRRWRHTSGKGPVRFRAVAPMQASVRAKNIGYFDTAVEAAIAFAKYVESPKAFATWNAARQAQAGSGSVSTTAAATVSDAHRAGKGDKLKADRVQDVKTTQGAKSGHPAARLDDKRRSSQKPADAPIDCAALSSPKAARADPPAQDGAAAPKADVEMPAASRWCGRMRERATPRTSADTEPSSTPHPAVARAAPMRDATMPAAVECVPSGATKAAKPRAWAGACSRTCGCVRASGHVGRCKVGSYAEEEYEVEIVLDERTNDMGHAEYLVKWRGWPLADCTWEVEEALGGCTRVLTAWKARPKQ